MGTEPLKTLEPVCTSRELLEFQQMVDTITVSREVRAYIAALAAQSRRLSGLQFGISTRAAIALLKASQAAALLDGRDYVLPDDVQRMMLPVLTHRFVLSAESKMRGISETKLLSRQPWRQCCFRTSK